MLPTPNHLLYTSLLIIDSFLFSSYMWTPLVNNPSLLIHPPLPLPHAPPTHSSIHIVVGRSTLAPPHRQPPPHASTRDLPHPQTSTCGHPVLDGLPHRRAVRAQPRGGKPRASKSAASRRAGRPLPRYQRCGTGRLSSSPYAISLSIRRRAATTSRACCQRLAQRCPWTCGNGGRWPSSG